MSQGHAPTITAAEPFDADAHALADQTDLRQRQRAVILAYSRRSVARGEPAKLMLDAAGLICETLQVPLRATIERTEPAEHWRMQVRGSGAGELVEHCYPADARQSLVAFAIEQARPIATTDLAGDTRFKDLFLRQAGIASALVLPLRSDGRFFGAIGAFSKRPHEFTTDDVEFAETISHLLISTIARVEMAQALAATRHTLSTLLEVSESIVMIADLEGNITRVNRTGERQSGYTMDELLGRPLWDRITKPEDLALVRSSFQQGLESGQAVQYESALLTKRGEERRIRWSQTAMLDDFSAARSMVLTGIDITELVELERELQQARGRSGSAGESSQLGQRSYASATGEDDSPGAFRILADEQHEQLRSSPRRAYPYRQCVAPLVDGKLPSKDEFIQVQFNDISAGGVSFVMSERPHFDKVVLQLGCVPNVHYMSAVVVNVIESFASGSPSYLVGCRFLERVHLQ